MSWENGPNELTGEHLVKEKVASPAENRHHFSNRNLSKTQETVTKSEPVMFQKIKVAQQKICPWMLINFRRPRAAFYIKNGKIKTKLLRCCRDKADG